MLSFYIEVTGETTRRVTCRLQVQPTTLNVRHTNQNFRPPILPHPPIHFAAGPFPPFLHIACTTPPIMNPFGFELPPIGASYDAPFSASSRFPSSSYNLRSYARPQTTRNDIGKGMRPKPTRKDIRESIQSKPTTNDIRKITPPEDVEREDNNQVQPRQDSYDKARDFITRFKSWHSGKLALSNSYLYDKKFTTQMSTKGWLKLGKVRWGGEAGLTKNLFKNQPRLSNPPPHPNKVS